MQKICDVFATIMENLSILRREYKYNPTYTNTYTILRI